MKIEPMNTKVIVDYGEHIFTTKDELAAFFNIEYFCYVIYDDEDFEEIVERPDLDCVDLETTFLQNRIPFTYTNLIDYHVVTNFGYSNMQNYN